LFYFFFFSSRRRHTRWPRDWSSYVCSSDLDVISVPPGVMRGFRNVGTEESFLLAILGGSDSGHVTWSPKVLETARQHGAELHARSEERRVGKECRLRGGGGG